MKYIVYKTTNLVNGKIYVGQHKQKANFGPYDFDGYLGSGKLLKEAIEKYGENNFIRETLFAFDDISECANKEKEIVNDRFVVDRNTYNLMIGGMGGDNLSFMSEERLKERNRKVLQTKIKNGTLCDRPDVKEKKSKGSKKRIVDSPHTLPNNKGRKHTGQKLLNMRETYKKRTGKFKWITNGQTTVLHNVSEPLPEGFYYGRNTKRFSKHTEESKSKISSHENIKGVICYTDGRTNIKLKAGQEPPPGFIRGMTQKHNFIWITNGIESKKNNPDGIVPDGWVRGRLKIIT